MRLEIMKNCPRSPTRLATGTQVRQAASAADDIASTEGNHIMAGYELGSAWPTDKTLSSSVSLKQDLFDATGTGSVDEFLLPLLAEETVGQFDDDVVGVETRVLPIPR